MTASRLPDLLRADCPRELRLDRRAEPVWPQRVLVLQTQLRRCAARSSAAAAAARARRAADGDGARREKGRERCLERGARPVERRAWRKKRHAWARERCARGATRHAYRTIGRAWRLKRHARRRKRGACLEKPQAWRKKRHACRRKRRACRGKRHPCRKKRHPCRKKRHAGTFTLHPTAPCRAQAPLYTAACARIRLVPMVTCGEEILGTRAEIARVATALRGGARVKQGQSRVSP